MEGQGRGRARTKESSLVSEVTTSSTAGRGRGRGRRLQAGTISGESAQHQQIEELVRRPNHGELGKHIELRVNFKLLEVPASLQIYCYHVDVLKVTKKDRVLVENRDVCRKIFWKVVSNNQEIFGLGYSLVYDDCHTLYSLNKLKTEKSTLDFQLFMEPKPGLKVCIPSLLIFRSREIAELFPPNVSFLVHILVTNYFAINTNEQLPNFRASMQLFGQSTSTLPVYTQESDMSTKVFYKVDMLLIDFYLAVLNEFVGRRRPYDIDSVCETFALSVNQRQQLKDAMKGLTLKLTYDDRHVKFIDVGLPARIQRFQIKRSDDSIEELTVEEYFNRYKNIRLRFPNLPVLHCGTLTRKDYFPMELLRLSDKVQRVKKRLTPFQIAKLIRCILLFKGTALSPLERFKKIDWFLKGMRISTDDEFLKQFGVIFPSVSNEVPESVRIPGRVLPSPELKFKTIELPATNVMFISPLYSLIKQSVCKIFEPFNTLIDACKFFGMEFVRENFGADTVEIYNWDTRREEADIYVRSFKKVCSGMGKEALKPLMIFITPERNDETYGRIKVTCDKEEGVACQVILAETFLKMRGNPKCNAVSHNVCLKINVKLDGINNEVARNQNYWKKFTDREASTLFMGIDVTHPPSGDSSAPSIAAIVGSINISATRYAASLKIQQPGMEVVTYTVDAFRKRIMEFGAKTGCKPQHIVVFRDGVSDSQFLDVMNDELLCLKTAIHQLDHLYHPTVSYVVVQKRHHTRFIEQDMKRDKGNNIPPGTVVDSTITSPLRFDFYLCSHRGAIGTSKPSHYIVLYDSWHLSADDWQMIYALCHVYARCNKSVSIPAPVYYAHLACDRAKRLLKYARMDEISGNEPSIRMLEQSFALNPDTPNIGHL
uniref:Piwi domain-containing protein n=1 Tax=Elaeophora elaphi TaxID=1147741 RepID=A0A158Q7C7_9BILA